MNPCALLLSRRLVAALALWLVTTAGAAAQPFDIDRLLAMLAAADKGRVGFVETRHLALLDAPLVSRGELVFVPPRRLERHTLTPRKESMVLDGDSLWLVRDGQRLHAALRDYPEAGALVDSVRATLAGERRTLEAHFLLHLAGHPAAWQLVLLPADPAIARIVVRIELEGRDNRLHTVRFWQADGDHSVLDIGPSLP